MTIGRKPHPFSNERHVIGFGLMSILQIACIVEGKYCPQQIGKKEYNQLGKMLSLMLSMCRPIFGSSKAVVLNIGFLVVKGIKQLESKGVYSGALIKKRCYCQKGVLWDIIYAHFEDKEVGYIVMVEARIQDNKLFKIFCMKDIDYVMTIMESLMTLDELEGTKAKRYFIDISRPKDKKQFT